MIQERVLIGDHEYTLRIGYQNDDTLRRSLDTLSSSIFGGLAFEKWYKDGYWTERSVPYSLFYEDRVVSHVLATSYRVTYSGKERVIVQIGTVMTDPEFRKRGLLRFLMRRIFDDHANAYEIFLFGNDSVLDFYPKLGFRRADEYRYTFEGRGDSKEIRKLDINSHRALIEHYCTMENPFSALLFHDAFETVMFHLTYFRCYEIYHIPELDALTVTMKDGTNTVLCDVFTQSKCTLADVVASVAGKGRVPLGFTPASPVSCTILPYHADDCTLFVHGRSIYSNEDMFFPVLCHT